MSTAHLALIVLSALSLHCGGGSTSPTTAREPSFRDFAAANDEAGFTELAASRFAAVLENVTVDSAPRTIRIGDAMVSLDRVYHSCRNALESCDSEMDAFISHGQTVLARSAEDTAPTLERLRLALRSADHVAMFRQRAGEVVSQPFVADLHAIVLVDFPESARPLLASELTVLGVSSEQAFERARSNVLSELGPMVSPPLVAPGQAALMQISSGRYYESSQLLDPARFAELAGHYGGKLYLSVPTPDQILAADSTSPGAAMAMTGIAQQIAAQGGRTLSTAVLVYENGTISALP